MTRAAKSTKRRVPSAERSAPTSVSASQGTPSDDLPRVYPDRLTFTVVTTTNRQPLAKRFRLTKTGELETETAAALTRGRAEVEHAASLADFSERLDRLHKNQAVLYGIPQLATAAVITKEAFERLRVEERRSVITRSREHVQFASAPGCLMLDFDGSGAPPVLLEVVASPESS